MKIESNAIQSFGLSKQKVRRFQTTDYCGNGCSPLPDIYGKSLPDSYGHSPTATVTLDNYGHSPTTTVTPRQLWWFANHCGQFLTKTITLWQLRSLLDNCGQSVTTTVTTCRPALRGPYTVAEVGGNVPRIQSRAPGRARPGAGCL